MSVHRIATHVQLDGSVIVHNTGFNPGDEVEVVVSPKRTTTTNLSDWTSLKGSVLKYDDPFESAAQEDDWDVCR